MRKIKKRMGRAAVLSLILFVCIGYLPVYGADKSRAGIIPKVQFNSAPITEYNIGERVSFNISSPNYGGKVEYRVVLWDDAKKQMKDLWSSENGFPTRYYTKWQPWGNNNFTLGWPINEPGTYRITVYAKRVGISNNSAALKGMNCDSYMESVAFTVNAKTPEVKNAGVELSDGNRIDAVPTDKKDDYYLDLSNVKSGVGIKASITVTENCKLVVDDKRVKEPGIKFNLKANEKKLIGPADFGMTDNDPPGVNINTLRELYADENGYITGSVNLEIGEKQVKTITFKVKIK